MAMSLPSQSGASYSGSLRGGGMMGLELPPYPAPQPLPSMQQGAPQGQPQGQPQQMPQQATPQQGAAQPQQQQMGVPQRPPQQMPQQMPQRPQGAAQPMQAQADPEKVNGVVSQIAELGSQVKTIEDLAGFVDKLSKSGNPISVKIAGLIQQKVQQAKAQGMDDEKIIEEFKTEIEQVTVPRPKGRGFSEPNLMKASTPENKGEQP